MNRQRRCDADGCELPRWRISGFCERHARAKWIYGSAHGRFIKKAEYAAEAHEASTFLKQHREHPAVQAALAVISDWLDAAGRGDRVPARDGMRRLWQASVDPFDVLRTAASIWLYSRRKPRALPDDDRLTYALSIGVLRLISQERVRSPNGNVRRCIESRVLKKEIGAYLRKRLSVFFVNLEDGLNKQEMDRRQKLTDLHMSFIGSARAIAGSPSSIQPEEP